MSRALHLVVLCLLLTGGCLAPATGGDQPTATHTDTPAATPTGTPPATPADLGLAAEAVQCEGSVGLAFWGLGDPYFWSSDVVRVGYTVPANTSLLLVAYVDGEPHGTLATTNERNDTTNVDGATLLLDRAFDERHAVRVVRHADADGDGAFDPGADPPCRGADGVSQAGPTVIDFGRFE
ncbi:hypothetical protein [Halobaculum marinum]|uniref:Uncharacterized protein n=1 Tax=Halobaculum marinum TaxID=3031996 RepID=A0ABD5X2Z3_9EURY|nr:hypothetical protein [Halobaculum sp. DT55]